ncbi:hypothetical protein BDW22DRAFT_1354500 [Trametopsis cervina]|nr:hypothetical protein BDW22DRAFT_1354500 [Trametopsis cervina]
MPLDVVMEKEKRGPEGGACYRRAITTPGNLGVSLEWQRKSALVMRCVALRYDFMFCYVLVLCCRRLHLRRYSEC